MSARKTRQREVSAYLVAGDDPLAIEETVRTIAQRALEGGNPEGVVFHYDGREVEPAEVLDSLRTPALWGPRRVLIVDEAQSFLKRAGEVLLRVLTRPTPGAVLILVARGETAPAAAFGKYRGVMKLVVCAAPRRREDWVRWVRGRATLRGKHLPPTEARFLLEMVGNDQMALDAEVEKLATYLGSRRRIHREDIEALVVPSRVEPIYALSSAVAEGDLAGALGLLEDLLAEGVQVPTILGVLRVELRRLWQVRRCRAAGLDPAQTARALGESRRRWLVEKLYRQVESFPERRLLRCFRELLKADLAVKTGEVPETVALERFVLAACGGP